MREVWGNCGMYGKGLDSEQANAYLCDWQSPTFNPKVRFHGTNWPCAEGRLHARQSPEYQAPPQSLVQSGTVVASQTPNLSASVTVAGSACLILMSAQSTVLLASEK